MHIDVPIVQEREDNVQHYKSISVMGVIIALIFSSFLLSVPSEAKNSFIPSISLQPTSQEVTRGETFQVDVYIDALDYRLRGATIDLTYTSTILQVTNVSLGPLFGSSALVIPGSGDDGAGHIHYTVLTSRSLSSSKGIFLTITFSVIGGIPGSMHLFRLWGILYSWSYDQIPETQVTSGFFIIGEPDYIESFKSVSLSGLDSNGDGRHDAVRVLMDVGTTGGVMDVFVKGSLCDPGGNTDDEAHVSWRIPGASPEDRSLYLYGDGPEGWFQVTLHLFDGFNHLEDTWTGTIYLYPLIPLVTHVNITPLAQTVKTGDSFSLAVTVSPGVAIAGIQLDILFNSSFLAITGIQEGNLFSEIDYDFGMGYIDNQNGTLTNIYATAIGGSVTDPGTFIILDITAKYTLGEGTVSIQDALVGDPEGREVPIAIQNATIYVEFVPFCDLNGDTRVNILDLVRVVSRWEKTGSPGWIVEDINIDGTINVLDVILMGEHWTG